MRQILRLFIVIILASLGFTSIQAQTPDWEAWMYNPDNGRMILIGSDRSIYADFILPGLQGNSYSQDVIVSPDGRIILYTLYNQNNGVISLYAYDTIVNSIAASYVIPSQQNQIIYTSIDMQSDEQSFSPDGNSVAFGYSIDGEWSVIVMDLFTSPGTVRFQLNESDPIASQVPEYGLDVAKIMAFDGFIIDFVIIAAATEGLPAYPHMTYDTRNNSLKRNIYYSVPFGDLHPSNGSYIFPIADFRTVPANPLYQQRGEHINSLHVHQEGTTSIYPVYTTGDKSVNSPRFIQNGEKVLFRTYDETTQSSDWLILEELPNGQQQQFLLSQFRNFFARDVENTGDGMLMTVNVDNNLPPGLSNLSVYPNRTVLMSYNTRADSTASTGTAMWIGEENVTYYLVGVTDNNLGTRPVAQPLMARGAPIDLSTYSTLSPFAANEQIVGSPTAQGTGNLQIGGQAQVFTTNNDRANMRSAAGISFPVVEKLSNGVVVNVINGPASNDGFVWWQVQFGSTTGWVVESADGVRVLQSYGATLPTPVPTPANISPPNAATNLFVGARVIVTADGNNLNARQSTSTNASVVAVYQTSEQLSIVGGPVNSEGYIWWQVNTDFGRAWVAEGAGDEKWIISING